MTDRKDLKRVVRARARRTGESYSSALRNVLNARPDGAAGSAGSHRKVLPVAVTRTIPDVRSTNVEKTTRFYTQLLGFDARVKDGAVVGFTSPTHAGVEVTLNRDGFALPPGFTVEVDTVPSVRVLAERAGDAGVRVIEDLRADQTQFSVLDPSGRRVTVTAGHGGKSPAHSAGSRDRTILRAIPGVTTGDPEATCWFYVDYLGLHLVRDNDGILLFRSPSAPLAQVIASTSMANPDGFDLDVGSLERLEHIHRAASGRWVVLHPPEDFPEHGIRCFMLLDPNGIGVNVVGLLEAAAAQARSGE